MECNVDKSYVMRIGNLDGELEEDILNLGFPFTNELTILGFILKNNGDMCEANYIKVKDKIGNIVRFWDRFNLSLAGKLAIYKTLILPQINFIATILTPNMQTFDDFEEQIRNFVTKGLNIAKKKLYLSPENGGLGMFDLKKFVAARL